MMTNLLHGAHVANKLFSTIARLRLLLVMFVALSVSINAWAEEGDILTTCQGTGSGYGTRRTLTNNDIGWVLSSGQVSSGTTYLGANNATNHGKVKPTATDLPVVKAVKTDATTSTTGYYFYYTSTPLPNVGSIEFYYSANSGNTSATIYVVSCSTKAASNSTTWSQISLASGNGLSNQGVSLGSSGTFKFKFSSTETSEKYYGIVIATTSYKRLTDGKITIHEGASAPTCASLEMSTVTATPGDSKITLTWSAVNNASNYTVTCSGGTAGSVTGASTKTCTITGLTNGTSYNWSVMPLGDGTTYCEENTPATGSTTPNATYSITYHDKDGAHSVDALGGSALLEVLPNNPTSCDIDIYPYFVGWSTTDIPSGGTTEQPTLVSAEIVNSITASKTYYAVWSDVDPNAGGGSWEKATSISVGDKVVFVHEEKKQELTGVANNIGTATEITNGIPNGIEGTYVLTIEAGTANNSYSFKNGSNYLSWPSGSNNLYTSDTKNNASSWTIDTSTDGNFKFANVGTNSRILQFNSSSPRWACYTSSQSSFQIYKQAVAIGTATYITSCNKEPTHKVTSTLSHVTADAENPESVLESAEDLTLAYLPEDGWNLPDAISVTMGGNSLSLDNEYTWDKEKGEVWIVPNNGFTGDIVVTINGWQQLAAPQNLETTDITATSATLSWGEVANASSYTVFITDLDDEEITLTDIEEASVDVTGLSPETLYLWEVVAIGDGANYTDSEHSSQEDPNAEFTTSAAASPATITLSELGVTSTIDTYSVGDQYTLPTTSSQSCDGKQLVGWSTEEVAETDTKPTENYYELGAKVTLAATQTFYAVFAAGSGGGGGAYTKVTTISDGTYLIAASKDENTSYAYTGVVTGKTYGGYTNVTITDDKITTKPNDALEITVKVSDNKFSMYDGTNYLCLTSDDNDLNFNNSIEKIEWTLSDGKIQNTYITSSTRYLQFNASSGSERFACYKNTQKDAYLYKKTGGGYTAYSTSCIPTYSITYDFAGGTGNHCSNTSVPQGEEYTICEEEPIKEGHTFLRWSDGINTYQPNDKFTPTSDITLTAQWQIKTYTVTWSKNGDTDEVQYNHGDALIVPTAESCDKVKEFVGWTEQSGYYHATTAPDDIFTTKTTPVTATATYYAVFATPPGTGGGDSGSETTTTLDFTTQGYADATAISNLTVDGVTATFAKGSNGSNAPKYYTSGTAIRAYGGNTITLSANQITAATFTFGSSDGSNEITADCGSWDSPTWTGDATDEVVFTISGSSGNRRIKSIAVTYTSGGGSGSYSDYTTTCQQVESIEVQSPQTEFYLTDDFTIGGGKVMATLSDGITKVDVTSLATFSGYNMEVVGTYTVTVTYMGATATYNINVKPLDNAWVLTWNVSGKTNTGLGPRYVTKGSAIGTLPTPEVPAACAGKTFMGWTESNIVPSDGVGIVYITPETAPTDNTTYYAVFATVNNFCTQKPIDQIASGSKVVIVAVASLTADGGSGKAISSRATDDTHNLQGDSVAIYDQTINTPHSTCIWTIAKEDGKCVFTQDGKYLNGVLDGNYSNLKYLETKDSWTLTPAASGMTMTYNMESTNASGEYIEWYNGKFAIHNEVNENGDFDMQFYVTANADGNADITDYTTGCEEYTITYYGFQGGYSTSCSSDGTIVLPVNSLHTVPNCGDVVTDHTNLGREFLNVWMTQPHGGHTFKPGDTFILTQDTTLYAQWEMETTSDVTTLPTDIEDLAGTDIYVYGGTTLNIQPGTTTINSLTLKGGLQADGSYKMPTVWVPEGATLVRNSNKIYLDLAINAKNYYPFAVPFATKNNEYVEYLDPVLAAASTYGTHFAIKTYNGERRAEVGEDKAKNWVRVLRDETLQPGVGYIITALTYPDKDTATIRIPMTVPNTWFENGEQAEVGTTVRNTIAVTAHAGAAATEHQRHAGWNFVANPYLSNFTGGGIDATNGLDYIDGELIIQGSYEYSEETVPYVTIPAYNFAYYSQHKLSDVKLSPEWSFFVQVGTSGTMDFTTAGRQQAPAHLAARAAEQPIKMDVDITLSDDNHSDQTGLIICDRFSDAYEIGHDLEKMFGSAYNLSVYTLMADNTPLAFQALAIQNSMQLIPVGYRTPAQGEYTFALNEATSDIELLNEQYEQLILVDYETGALTNMLNNEYTFYSDRTQSNNRFALYAVPRQNTTTDLPNTIGNEEVRKVIYNDHFYILRDGKVFNGAGQIVK